MPKLTLVLGRKTVQVYDIDAPLIRVGRDEAMEIHIDNPSVSRQHAEIRNDAGSWVVADLGSSNGTFLNGERLAAPTGVSPGDEISMGKFSILFEKTGVEAERPAPQPKARAAVPDFDGTMQIKPHEVEEILSESSRKRRAHIVWESGGRRGEHFFGDRTGVVVGTDELCDVRVPKGPAHHLLVIQGDGGWEARNLGFFGKMTVDGAATKRGRLKDGSRVELKGVSLTFAGEI